MYKKLVLLILTVAGIMSIIFIFVSNISYNKVVLERSGMVVSDFVIINGKTVPSYIDAQQTVIHVNINSSRFFSYSSMTGNITINGISYKIVSSDFTNEKYIGSLKPASSIKNEIAGDIKISDDLEIYSIRLSNSPNYIVGPAQNKEEAVEIVHTLYGTK